MKSERAFENSLKSKGLKLFKTTFIYLNHTVNLCRSVDRLPIFYMAVFFLGVQCQLERDTNEESLSVPGPSCFFALKGFKLFILI